MGTGGDCKSRHLVRSRTFARARCRETVQSAWTCLTSRMHSAEHAFLTSPIEKHGATPKPYKLYKLSTPVSVFMQNGEGLG